MMNITATTGGQITGCIIGGILNEQEDNQWWATNDDSYRPSDNDSFWEDPSSDEEPPPPEPIPEEDSDGGEPSFYHAYVGQDNSYACKKEWMPSLAVLDLGCTRDMVSRSAATSF